MQCIVSVDTLNHPCRGIPPIQGDWIIPIHLEWARLISRIRWIAPQLKKPNCSLKANSLVSEHSPWIPLQTIPWSSRCMIWVFPVKLQSPSHQCRRWHHTRDRWIRYRWVFWISPRIGITTILGTLSSVPKREAIQRNWNPSSTTHWSPQILWGNSQEEPPNASS